MPKQPTKAAVDAFNRWRDWLGSYQADHLDAGEDEDDVGALIEELIAGAHYHKIITTETAVMLAEDFGFDWADAQAKYAGNEEQPSEEVQPNVDTLGWEDIERYATNTRELYAKQCELGKSQAGVKVWREHIQRRVLPLYEKQNGAKVSLADDFTLGRAADALRTYYRDHVKEL